MNSDTGITIPSWVGRLFWALLAAGLAVGQTILLSAILALGGWVLGMEPRLSASETSVARHETELEKIDRNAMDNSSRIIAVETKLENIEGGIDDIKDMISSGQCGR